MQKKKNGQIIAQANAQLDDKGNFLIRNVKARLEGDFPVVSLKISFNGCCTKSNCFYCRFLIPFLEHDDANRALMGSNMHASSSTFIKAKSPIVGTGLEEVAARF